MFPLWEKAIPHNGPFIWVLLLSIPLAMIALGALWGSGSLVEWVVRVAFAPFCHQQPDRAILVGEVPLAVCARCTGLYVGLAMGGWLALLFRWVGRRPTNQLVLAALAVPAIDGLAGWLGWWSSGPLLRAGTGLLAAFPLALLLMMGKEDGTTRG